MSKKSGEVATDHVDETAEAGEPEPPRLRPAVETRGPPDWLVYAAAVSWRLLLVALALGVVAYGLLHVRIVVIPVVVAVAFTSVLSLPARWLVGHGWPPLIAALAVFVVSAAAVAGAAFLLVPPLVDEATALASDVEAGIDQLLTWLRNGPLGLTADDIDGLLASLGDELGGGGGVVAGAITAVEIVAGALLSIVLTFFFVKDGPRIWRAVASVLPSSWRDHGIAVGGISWRVTTRYIRGVAVVGVVDATFIGLGLYLLGVPLVLPLAVLTFFGAFFPIVGATVAGAIAALVALSANGLTTALVVVAITIVVQQLEGDLVAPLVLGRSVRLHPVIVLLSLAAGAVIGGVFGAAIAVPLAAICSRVVDHYRGDLDPDVRESVDAAFATADADRR